MFGRGPLITVLGTIVNIYCIMCDSTLEIVGRSEWGARSPKDRFTIDPVNLVVIHHTYIPGACFNRTDCIKAMRSMQDFHMDTRGWSDIAYNFAIGGDAVYEGRGWQVLGAHAQGHNNNSVGIVFIGDYRDKLPSIDMLKMCKELIQLGVANNHIQPNYQLVGHRQLRNTECPGGSLYEVVQTWGHWVPDISDGNTTRNNGQRGTIFSIILQATSLFLVVGSLKMFLR